MEANGIGRRTVNYKLRDWLISRQRYWGAPIPMVYCDSCGEVPVPEKNLPVLLPETVEFLPTGQSPLTYIKEFLHTLPSLGGKKGAAFCTVAAVGARRTLDYLKEQFQHRGATFVGGFSCRGRTGIFFGYGPRWWALSHPNIIDIEKAKVFARSFLD